MADSRKVQNKTNLLATQRDEQFKQHLVYDAQDRVLFVFSAKIDAVQGDPCLVVEYVYRGPTSTQVKDMQERVTDAGWQTTWDADFTFDPTTVYDADGDGV